MLTPAEVDRLQPTTNALASLRAALFVMNVRPEDDGLYQVTLPVRVMAELFGEDEVIIGGFRLVAEGSRTMNPAVC